MTFDMKEAVRRKEDYKGHVRHFKKCLNEGEAPDILNGFSDSMADALSEALESFDSDDIALFIIAILEREQSDMKQLRLDHKEEIDGIKRRIRDFADDLE